RTPHHIPDEAPPRPRATPVAVQLCGAPPRQTPPRTGRPPSYPYCPPPAVTRVEQVMRLAFLALIALTAYPQDPSKAVNLYSQEKEKALGEQLAQEVRRSSTSVNDPAILSWINGLAKRLVQGSRLSDSFGLL